MTYSTSEQPPKRDFVKRDFECPIIFQLFNDPIVTACGHTFEGVLVNDWKDRSKTWAKEGLEKVKSRKFTEKEEKQEQETLQQHAEQGSCPYCKGPLEISQDKTIKKQEETVQFYEQHPEYFPEQYPTDGSEKDVRVKELASILACIKKGKTEEAIQKLRAQRYLNVPLNNKGLTAMHAFAMYGNLEGLRQLIRLGTNLSQLNLHDQSPLDLAVQHTHKDCFDLLITNGATTIKTRNLVTFLEENNTDKILEELNRLKNVFSDLFEDLINNPVAKGMTLLRLAAKANNPVIIEWLIENGANIDSVDAEQRTALHWAAIDGHVERYRLLVSLGASPWVKDKENKTPYEIANDKEIRIDDDTYFSNILEAFKKSKQAGYSTLIKYDENCFNLIVLIPHLKKFALAKGEEILKDEAALSSLSSNLRWLDSVEKGIEGYLTWRENEAPGSRISQIARSGSFYLHHGQSGIDRAMLIKSRIEDLKNNWSPEEFQKFHSQYHKLVALSSNAEHSLKNCLERSLRSDRVAFLEQVKQGIKDYLAWSDEHAKGMRVSHLYHGQAGRVRAQKLQGLIEALEGKEITEASFSEFEKDYDRILAKSSNTKHSLANCIRQVIYSIEVMQSNDKQGPGKEDGTECAP
jgi:ankyrin repeat protein